MSRHHHILCLDLDDTAHQFGKTPAEDFIPEGITQGIKTALAKEDEVWLVSARSFFSIAKLRSKCLDYKNPSAAQKAMNNSLDRLKITPLLKKAGLEESEIAEIRVCLGDDSCREENALVRSVAEYDDMLDKLKAVAAKSLDGNDFIDQFKQDENFAPEFKLAEDYNKKFDDIKKQHFPGKSLGANGYNLKDPQIQYVFKKSRAEHKADDSDKYSAFILDDKTLYPTTTRNDDGSRPIDDESGKPLGTLRTFTYHHDTHGLEVAQIITDGKDPLKHQIRQIIALLAQYKDAKEREAADRSLSAFFHYRRVSPRRMVEASGCLIRVLRNILNLLNNNQSIVNSSNSLNNYFADLLQSTRLRNIISNIPFAQLKKMPLDLSKTSSKLRNDINDLATFGTRINSQQQAKSSSFFSCCVRSQPQTDWVKDSAQLFSKSR